MFALRPVKLLFESLEKWKQILAHVVIWRNALGKECLLKIEKNKKQCNPKKPLEIVQNQCKSECHD